MCQGLLPPPYWKARRPLGRGWLLLPDFISYYSSAFTIGEFRIPRGLRTSACFFAKARLMRIPFSTRRQTNMRKLRLSCRKKGKFETLKGFGDLKTYLQAWKIIVSNSERKISSSLGKSNEFNQKLTEIVVGTGVSSIKMRRWFQNPFSVMVKSFL